ncbi:MAG: UDP-N-acetylglucosamine--N-acetylmuramyl-(pentapeptide) pyrophosphoryl-undecaprenol N-acetylglucosamine transferase [Candidatus Tokpelaia sp. JSC161]|jgi:UDP-N-acetylglucosamine--N-acetylmuramyl-(pentapeptide) pyrophosphoryl-undecaprenol N-acetylglucosamine transferase|nr:MAG: UDP-N-acetylglucosamine--N-acetylmuramyl-(pentapeptide) pyrophosphoryl-undecaprenol N-acetylglucosamine transferase [Candidatus Tokpelaia sp. JSC161]
MGKKTIFLAAGGTGGHLFPAEALGVALRSRGFDVHLLTDKRAEHFITAFPSNRIHVVKSISLSLKNPLRFLKGLFQVIYSLYQSYRLIRKFTPSLVAGFGSYPSLTPVYVAIKMNIPSFIHEQNAVMGRVNKFLSSRIAVIASGFLSLEDKFADKLIVIGNPLRMDVIQAARTPYVAARNNSLFSLLVFGGSQGAMFFSRLLPEAVSLLDRSIRRRLVITQQAPASDIEYLKKAYKAFGVMANVQSFFRTLSEQMARSHYVIARSGALSVSEISAIGRPALLVPYPSALDDDQRHNAEFLLRYGGVTMMLQKDLSSTWLAELISNVVENPDSLEIAAKKVRSAGRLEATQKLADITQALLIGKSLDEIKKEIGYDAP